jgi:SAM-dependent methyltransferase
MSAAEPDYAKSMRDRKDLPWYLSSIEKNITPSTRRLLKDYSQIPPSEVVNYVHKVRDKAWDIRSYPCTGLGRWLVPTIDLSPACSNILARLKEGQTLLDIGAYLGQDLRKLVFDGAPSEKLIGVDIASHWDLGYELYNDKVKFSARFLESDILGNDARLLELESNLDIIWVSQVLHQWDWETQLKCCRRFVKLTKIGSLVAGSQIGNVKGQSLGPKPAVETDLKETKVSPAFSQSPETITQLWAEASEATGTKWTVEAMLRTWEEVDWDPEDQRFLPEGSRVLDFVAIRTA